MKIKSCRKWFAGMIMTAAIGTMAVIPAFASVGTVRLTFTNSYETGEVLEPTITTRTSGVTVESIEWSKEVEDWKPGKRVQALVTLSANDDFSASYSKKNCIISGATFSSASVEGDELVVKANYYPVVELDMPESAEWSKTSPTVAQWDKVDYATGYQVRLYCAGDYLRTIQAATNKIDLAEYMTKEGNYYYEVRATGKDNDDQKYFKYSEYTLSEDMALQNLGDTTGKWRSYTEGKKYQTKDGNYVTNAWHKILGKWYYFDENSYMVTGWRLVGTTWYYMDQNGVMLTGWIEDNGIWYYLNNDGSMATGWVQRSPSEWYYFYPNGTLAVNADIDGYWVNEKGIWTSN